MPFNEFVIIIEPWTDIESLPNKFCIIMPSCEFLFGTHAFINEENILNKKIIINKTNWKFILI